MIQQVNNHLHYARRTQLRMQISESIRQRGKFRFKRGKLGLFCEVFCKNLNFVLTTRASQLIMDTSSQTQNRYNLNWIQFFQELHSRKPLVDLATYLCETPNLWKDFEQQRNLLTQYSSLELPPDILRLFTEALLHTENDEELFEEMKTALQNPIEFEDFLKVLFARANNKSPGITGCSINMMKQWTDRIQHLAYIWSNELHVDREIHPQLVEG